MVCRGYMVDRHYVWCSMMGSVIWDNVQNESYGFKNEKYVCWEKQVGVDPPQGEQPGIEVRHDHRR